MSRIQRVRCIAVAVGVSTLAAACSRGNEERAYFTKQGERYLVEMKGRRRAMAHDPASAVRGRTYEETLTIDLPRIEGVVDGAEIPVSPDKLRYTGRVVITKHRMTVDLYYDDGTRHPLPWNGEYTLVPKDTAGTP